MSPSPFTDAHVNVARELANASLRALTVDGNVHPGTVIAATARMAGTYLFRSLVLDVRGVRPGDVVLSVAANEQVPLLIKVAAAIVTTGGIALDDATAALPVRPQHKPRQSFLETQRVLEPLYRAITGASGMSDYEGARAAAVAAGMLIRQCVKVLEANEAFRIAAYGFVEGTKTAPEPLQL
jgi:hypothetical protein